MVSFNVALFICICYEILIENIPRVHSLPKTIQILYRKNNGDSIYEKKVYAHNLLVVTRHNKMKILSSYSVSIVYKCTHAIILNALSHLNGMHATVV